MPDSIAQVAKLIIYPIKSLDGMEVDRVTVLQSGALQGDRTYALVDTSGNFVNGKRHAAIHKIRAEFDSSLRTVSLKAEGYEQATTLHLKDDQPELEAWLSEYFGFQVRLVQNLEMGFPDDTDSPGATIVSQATLEAIASWFELSLEEVRRRFRANIEIDGVPAFWEDHLFAEADQRVSFHVGDIQFLGVNPCQRCVVVTRNSQTGEAYPNFQKTFIANRAETLPDGVERSRFNHFFRLAINTRVPRSEQGKAIHIGAEVEIQN